MFSNLILVAVIAIILWVGLFLFYLASSQRHQSIEEELQSLEKMIESDGDHETVL